MDGLWLRLDWKIRSANHYESSVLMISAMVEEFAACLVEGGDKSKLAPEGPRNGL